jgi:Concanavalin A-like lectin/glucanases superfamily
VCLSIGVCILLPPLLIAGFSGVLDDVFVYAAALNTWELDFLRTAAQPPLAPVAGGAGYALQLAPSQKLVAAPVVLGSAGLRELIVSLWLRPAAAQTVEAGLLDWSDSATTAAGADDAAAVALWSIAALTDAAAAQLVVRVTVDTDSMLATCTSTAAAVWSQLTVAWVAGAITVSTNGALCGTRSYNSTAVPTVDDNGRVWIGASRSGLPAFSGELDDVQIWTSMTDYTAATAAATTAGAVELVLQNAAGLAAWWPFSEGVFQL